MNDSNSSAQQSIENINAIIKEIDDLIANDGSPERIAELQDVRSQLLQVLATLAEHMVIPKEFSDRR